MAKASFTNDGVELSFGLDSIVIAKYISGIKGGRTLDMTGFSATGDVLPAGWPIITDGEGAYKPMPASKVENSDGSVTYSLGEMPSGFAYCGVLYRSILVSHPAASIMFNGEVNSVAAPVTYPDAFKAACPLIKFVVGEAA